MEANNSKCLREDKPYSSRFPLYKWRVDCWAQSSSKSIRYKAHIIVYAETQNEAITRAGIWEELIIKITKLDLENGSENGFGNLEKCP